MSTRRASRQSPPAWPIRSTTSARPCAAATPSHPQICPLRPPSEWHAARQLRPRLGFPPPSPPFRGAPSFGMAPRGQTHPPTSAFRASGTASRAPWGLHCGPQAGPAYCFVFLFWKAHSACKFNWATVAASQFPAKLIQLTLRRLARRRGLPAACAASAPGKGAPIGVRDKNISKQGRLVAVASLSALRPQMLIILTYLLGLTHS
jgi:hypothetical protein